jgi:hypothetical protein
MATDATRRELTGPDLLYAGQVVPGMVICHPHGCSDADNGPGSGALDVMAVAGPDDDGMVYLTSPHETVRVAGDWPVRPYTAADADFEAFLLVACAGLTGKAGTDE